MDKSLEGLEEPSEQCEALNSLPDPLGLVVLEDVLSYQERLNNASGSPVSWTENSAVQGDSSSIVIYIIIIISVIIVISIVNVIIVIIITFIVIVIVSNIVILILILILIHILITTIITKIIIMWML